MPHTLAEIRAEMARQRPQIQTTDMARKLGMSRARCSTLLNGDPDLDLTPEGAKRWSAALEELVGVEVGA